MCVNISFQHWYKILQNYLKPLMSYQQEFVGATFGAHFRYEVVHCVQTPGKK